MSSRPNTVLAALRPRAITKLARGLFNQGHRDEALALLRRAHAARANDLTLCRALAEFLERDEQPERADVYFRHALRLAPTDVLLRLDYAFFLSRRGMTHAASEAAEATLELIDTVMVAALGWPCGWPLRVKPQTRASLQALADLDAGADANTATSASQQPLTASASPEQSVVVPFRRPLTEARCVDAAPGLELPEAG